jgi:hypothetical protein
MVQHKGDDLSKWCTSPAYQRRTAFDSSPPDGTELRHAKTLFSARVHEATGLSSPARCCAKHITHGLETTHDELVFVKNEFVEHQKLLRSCKYHEKSMRVKLKPAQV